MFVSIVFVIISFSSLVSAVNYGFSLSPFGDIKELKFLSDTKNQKGFYEVVILNRDNYRAEYVFISIVCHRRQNGTLNCYCDGLKDISIYNYTICCGVFSPYHGLKIKCNLQPYEYIDEGSCYIVTNIKSTKKPSTWTETAINFVFLLCVLFFIIICLIPWCP